MNKKLILFFTIATLLSQAYPLSDTAVRNIAIGSGIASGIGGMVAGSSFVDTGREGTNTFIAATTGLASGSGVGFLTYWYLNKYYTPRGCYENSLKYIEKIQEDYFFADELEEQKDLIAYINSVWTNRWPLISAKNHLSDVKNKLLSVVDNLKKAINELKKKYKKTTEDKRLMNDCITLISLLPDLIKTVQDRIAIIIADKNYNFQMSLFHQHEEHEKQMQHEALQGSLNRWEKSRGRWAKEKIAKEKINHQTNLVNGIADILTSNNNQPINDLTDPDLYDQNSHYWQQSQSGMYPNLDNDYGYVPPSAPSSWY